VCVLLLQALREKRDQTQVAFGAKVGLNQTDISRLERGLAKPSDELLARLAAELGVSPAYLLLRPVVVRRQVILEDSDEVVA